MRTEKFRLSDPPHLWFHTTALLTLILGTLAVIAGPPQVLPSSLPKELAKAYPAGRLPATTQMNLAIALPLRNQSALTNLLHELYDPSSSQYHRFLKSSQFTQKFGPTVTDYQKVLAFAKANHLKVTHTHPNRTIVDVSGSVSDIENTFHVLMKTYQHPKENRTFYAPNTPPSVQLSIPLLGISGLNDYSRPQPLLKATRLSKSSNASPNSGSGPSGTYMGNDFRAAYVPDSTLNGAGQVVGLLQFDGYTASDITYYEQKAGLPAVPLQNVLLDGFNGNPTGNGGEVEVSLDIEMTISMAPGLSKIILYEAGPYGNWHDLLNRMATDNQAKQLSCSWYSPGMGADPVADQIFQQMAAQGQSFMNASGDNDAYTGLIPFPGDTPYITQVGGTTLTTSGPSGPRVSETVWNRGNGIGSGGGVSTSYPIPDYQKGVNMSGNQGSTTMRNTPDVALTAENVYVRADGYDYQVGGTSCSAPLWAGFMALVNQKAVSAGKPTLGFINPAVYSLGESARYTSALHDITTGNNTSSSSPSKFYAVAGYDLCTGWGTPAGYGLITALAIPDALQIVPGTGFTATGVAGGPFDITSQQYTLTNVGTASLNWSLANTSAWLTASSSSGTLSPGGPASLVTIGLNSAASNLVAGLYESTVWFTNLTDGVGQNLQFTLNVLVAPSITSPPTNVAVIQGAFASFYVQASGSTPLSYRWRFNGTNLNDGGNIAGSATTKLTVSAVSPSDVGAYSVVVTNIVGEATSSNAQLSITPSPPLIVTQPASQTVAIGAPASFSVGLEGTPPFTYQWRHASTNLAWGTDAVLMLTNVQPVDGGIYSVVVSNSLGYAVSSNAVLSPVHVPLIFSFSPLAAAAGATITINGTGFDSAASNDVVYFGPVKAAVLSATADMLQVTVPPGATYAPITVTVNGLVAYANAAFEPTFLGDGSAISTSSFAPSFNLSSTNGPQRIVLADFDGDGKPDLAVVNAYAQTFSIYQNIGTNGPLSASSFAAPVVIPFGTIPDDPLFITAADVDGDGKIDILLPDANANTVVIYRNISSSGVLTSNSFAPPVAYPVGNLPQQVVVRDLDGDGKPDIIVANYNDGTISILHNLSVPGPLDTNSFAPRVDIAAGTGANAVAAVDLNGDGKPDLAVASAGSPFVSILQNQSTLGALDTNSFAAPVNLPCSLYGDCIISGDIDGDGKPDLLLMGYQGAPLSVFRNLSAGGALSTNSFAGPVNFNVSGWGHTLALADFNGDGKPDIALVTEMPSQMSIFQNLSTPGDFTSASLGPRIDFGSGYNAWGVVAGDLDGDGRPDIAFANQYDNTLTFYRNLVGFGTAPVITSQPVSVNAFAGQTVAFSVLATGALPLDYQWIFNGTNTLAGETNATLTLFNVQATNDGYYAVLVTNSLGSVLSSNALLVVSPPPTNLPTIFSFTPLSATTGATITIIGSGFSSIASNNIVYFGPVRAIVLSASTTTLQVSVPPGATYGPITVTVNGLVAYANASFQPTFLGDGSGISTASFAPSFNLSSTNGPQRIVLADFDGDGKPDLAVVNAYAQTFSIYQNIGTNGPLSASSFGTPVVIPFGTTPDDPLYITAADVDGDGKIDILLPDANANTVVVYRNISSGGVLTRNSFAAPVAFPVGNLPQQVVVRDVDGDGHPDIVVANYNDGTISVLRNLSGPGPLSINSFAPKVDIAVGAGANGIAVVDLNGDGKPDLAVANAGSAYVSILQNQSTLGVLDTNSFAPPVNLPCSLNGDCIISGDIDGDGKPDLLLMGYQGAPLSVFRNLSTGGMLSLNSFAPPVNFDVGGSGHMLALADFNGDGKPDIALVTELPSHMSIFENLSTLGSFTPASLGPRVDFTSGYNAWGVVAGDLDGDGRPDIAFANQYDNTLTFYRNVMNVSAPSTNPPVIISFSPVSAPAGATVSILGSGFNSIPTHNIVYFGPVRATVLSANPTNLVVTVPAGATYAPLTIAVAGFVGYANLAFQPTFTGNGSPISSSSFAPSFNLPSTNGPQRIVLADFDGDGKPDFAVVNAYAQTFSIYQNTGTNGPLSTSSFAPPVVIPFGTSPNDPLYITAADVDGDGKIDILLPDANANTVVVYRNISSGGVLTSHSFAAPVSYSVGNLPQQVVVHDLDGDGHPDILAANYNDGTISVLRNLSGSGPLGTNSFAPKVDFAVGAGANGIAVVDLDGDGKPDLAVANAGSAFVSILQNQSIPGSLDTNSFASPVNLPCSANGDCIISGDIDGDGKPDLLLIGYQGAPLSVFRNLSTGGTLSTNSFAAPVSFDVGGSGHTLALADFNGDGKPDIALVTELPSHMSIFQNLSTPGSFTTASLGPRVDFTSGYNAWGVVAGDLDGDGRPDIAFANQYDNTLTFYRNVMTMVVPQTNPPVIISFSPALAPVGVPVTIIGQGFDPVPTNNIVYFGAVRATVVSASPTNLLVSVPTGATYASITVTVNGLTAFSNGAFEPSFFGTSSLSASTFAPPFTLPASNGPIRVVIADLNNDGKPDLVVANVSAHTISVYQNVSTSGTLNGPSFAAPFTFNVGSGTYDPYSVSVGDVDGDGRLDLLVPDSNNNVVTIYRNLSNGGALSAASFAAPVSFTVGIDPRKVVLWDLDGDGRPDIITANSSGNSISVLRNLSSPGSVAFAAKIDFSTGSNPDLLAVGDLDGDGKPDIAVPSGNALSIFRNTSTPGTIDTNSLAPRVDLPAPSLPLSAVIGDIDGDGKPDLLFGSYLGQTLSVYRNLASPGSLTSNSFAPRIDFPAGNGFHTLALADLNGDGKPDVVQVGESPSKLSISQNLSTPGLFTNSSLGPRIDFSATANNAWGVSVGDLDGDGRPDVVFADQYGNTLSIFQNVAPMNPPPIIVAQPGDQRMMPGCNASFTVVASGASLNYQWWKGAQLLAGQTNSSLNLSNVQSTDFSAYSAVVSNPAGSVTSSNAFLILDQPPIPGSDVVERYSWGGLRAKASDLMASATSPEGDTLAIVGVSAFSSAGGTVGLTNNWVYYLPPPGFTNSDTFTYTVSDGHCGGLAVGTVTVQIRTNNSPASVATIEVPASGSFRLTFIGSPGTTYRIQFTDNLASGVWSDLGSATADIFGSIEVTDTPAANTVARFYRSVSP